MTAQIKIIWLIALALFIALIISIIQFNKANEKYLSSEINSQDYFNLLLKYNYLKGSVEGNNLKKSLQTALSDNLISNREYKSVTGKDAKIVVFEKPEEKQFYKDAKQKLVHALKN